jgi:hypothetical protein
MPERTVTISPSRYLEVLSELQLGLRDYSEILLSIHGTSYANAPVRILAVDSVCNTVTFGDEDSIWDEVYNADINDIYEFQVIEEDYSTPQLELDTLTQFPSDATVSFNYTTARGSQKSITGLTPAFVRPSETHAGKNILVGFVEQEDGSFVRKTFRTDRITNLVRDNA